uniref:Kinesin motor domain-containing protein n=1 Tax=Steinernema glaseri TaxID=37863 RepID=A0A1I8AJY7_9BILA
MVFPSSETLVAIARGESRDARTVLHSARRQRNSRVHFVIGVFELHVTSSEGPNSLSPLPGLDLGRPTAKVTTRRYCSFFETKQVLPVVYQPNTEFRNECPCTLCFDVRDAKNL